MRVEVTRISEYIVREYSNDDEKSQLINYCLTIINEQSQICNEYKAKISTLSFCVDDFTVLVSDQDERNCNIRLKDFNIDLHAFYELFISAAVLDETVDQARSNVRRAHIIFTRTILQEIGQDEYTSSDDMKQYLEQMAVNTTEHKEATYWKMLTLLDRNNFPARMRLIRSIGQTGEPLTAFVESIRAVEQSTDERGIIISLFNVYRNLMLSQLEISGRDAISFYRVFSEHMERFFDNVVRIINDEYDIDLNEDLNSQFTSPFYRLLVVRENYNCLYRREPRILGELFRVFVDRVHDGSIPFDEYRELITLVQKSILKFFCNTGMNHPRALFYLLYKLKTELFNDDEWGYYLHAIYRGCHHN